MKRIITIVRGKCQQILTEQTYKKYWHNGVLDVLLIDLSIKY